MYLSKLVIFEHQIAFDLINKNGATTNGHIFMYFDNERTVELTPLLEG